MADIKALLDGGRSLEMTAVKRNPTKKTEPIATKKQPQKILSLEESSCKEEEEEAEEDLIALC
jgi:hypothetical protein